MGLFSRRSSKHYVPTSSTQPRDSIQLASAGSLPEPSVDQSDTAKVRAEWETELQGREQGILGWRNGTRMFGEDPIPAQRVNVAEYLTRGLAYHLFSPVLSDQDALIAARNVLHLVDRIPAEPAFAVEFGPKLSRLALTIIRENRWQPAELGGDGSVVGEIVDARRDGLVVYSARCPGVPVDRTWQTFFAA
jgi:hypothetical protein